MFVWLTTPVVPVQRRAAASTRTPACRRHWLSREYYRVALYVAYE